MQFYSTTEIISLIWDIPGFPIEMKLTNGWPLLQNDPPIFSESGVYIIIIICDEMTQSTYNCKHFSELSNIYDYLNAVHNIKSR